MTNRSERALAWFTTLFVVTFGPIETAVSWRFGLLSPHYLVDAIGVVLLAIGAWQSLRAKSNTAPAMLAVGWAWIAANFWRATLERQERAAQGHAMDFGRYEIPGAIMLTAIAMLCMFIAILVMLKRSLKSLP